MSAHQTHRRVSAAYRSAAETHPPARQIVMLHDGAIQRIEEAKAAIAARRIEARFNLVMKAHAIIGALQSCLDFDQGGEVAPLLDRFYGYVLGRLTLINLRDDPAICDELVRLLRQMRDSWAEIAPGPAIPTPVMPPAGTVALGPASLTA
jgi:flagellar secretion chaperone FliS